MKQPRIRKCVMRYSVNAQKNVPVCCVRYHARDFNAEPWRALLALEATYACCADLLM